MSFSRVSKDNPPEEQIIYKLGALEQQVKSLGDTIENAFKTLESKIDSTTAQSKIDNGVLSLKIEQLERRVKFLEEWRMQLFTKLGFVISAISVFWFVFGEAVKNSVDSIIG